MAKKTADSELPSLDELVEDAPPFLVKALKSFITGVDAKTLIEYGIYGGTGLLTFVALGEMKKSKETPPHEMGHMIAMFREMLISTFRSAAVLTNWSLGGMKPLFFIGEPSNMFFQSINIGTQKQDPDGNMAEYWSAVPMPLRIMFSVMIPSMMLLIKETFVKSVEMSGIV